MGLNKLIQEKRREILEIAARHGDYNVRLFGSVSRGEADEASDVDILVELEPNRSLLDLDGEPFSLIRPKLAGPPDA